MTSMMAFEDKSNEAVEVPTPGASMEEDAGFLLIALVVSLRSRDPSTQVGALVTDACGHILSSGFNRLSRGLDETSAGYRRDGAWLGTKYPYMLCAELDALLSCAGSDLRDHRLYTTLHPCHLCAKAIVEKGIGEVVYLEDKYPDKDFRIAAGRILAAAGVKARRPSVPWSADVVRALIRAARRE